MQQEPPAAAPPKGFVSADAKRSFTVVTIVIAIVALALQMGVPMVVVVVAIPLSMLKLDRKRPQLSSSAYFDGKLWYIAEGRARGPKGARQRVLMSMARQSRAEPVEVASLPLGTPGYDSWLVAGPDRLWAVCEDGAVAEYQHGHITLFPAIASLTAGSRPFAWQGRPAVVDLAGGSPPSELVLRVFQSGAWTEQTRMPFGSLPRPRRSPRSVLVAAEEQRLHVFVQVHDGTVHYAEASLRGSAPTWERVDSAPMHWGVAMTGGKPALIRLGMGRWSRDLVVTRRDSPGVWADVLTHRMPPAIDFGVVPLDPPDEVAVVARLSPPRMHVTEIRAGSVVADDSYGEDPMAFIMKLAYGLQFALFPVSLLVALLLSAQMRKHRIAELWVDGKHYELATLNRRAVAQVVDSTLTAGPGLALFLVAIDSFDRLTDVAWWFEHLWVFAISFGLWALGVVVFAWLEGRWGRTPGKWLFGIRVMGTDAQPCGFGRGLLRNALELADGMFHFLAGLLAVAFTEKWQRLGDLAARTVVVRVEPRS